MSEEEKEKKTKKILSAGQMSRRDVVEAVTDPGSVIILGEKAAQRSIEIPTTSSIKADIADLIQEMEVPQDSLMYRIVLLFCEEKKASAINAKVFIMRIRNMNDEQLKAVGLLCGKPEFTATNILRIVQSVKRFDADRLLALRGYMDLEGFGPGPLNQFFITTLPQSNRKEVGSLAYENEVREKAVSPEQNNVFYHICYQVDGIVPAHAITILRKVRQLKSQHALIINTFLRKGVMFGDRPISSENIINLINLWLSLPELNQENRLKRMIKRLSRKSDDPADFKLIAESFIQEIAKEKSKGKFVSFIDRFFN